MAADDSSNTVSFKLKPDEFKLVRHEGGVKFFAEGPTGELQLIFEDLGGCELKENRDLSFIGRPVGKLDLEVSAQESSQSPDAIVSMINSWFPVVEGDVLHIQNGMDEFNDQIQSNEIVVGKFSAEWCGPCKMVAPKIKKLSAQYPNVRFLHIDVDSQKAVSQANSISCMPTFLFWKNGAKLEKKVEGADVQKIEAFLKEHAGSPAEIPGCAPFTEEVELKLVCESEEWTLTKTGDTVRLSVDGKERQEKVPEIKIDPKTGKFKLGRSSFELNRSHQDEFAAISEKIASWYPTNVIHIHSTAEFDEILKQNAKVVAKFSADWCGPCHAIAPTFTALSLEYENIKMLHVDVDQCAELSSREGIQAMPTFKFFLGGVHQGDFNVRGANAAALKKGVKDLNEKP